MSSKCVLVVADDALVRWALEKELGTHGVTVHGAETGACALRRIREASYPIVVVDVELPDVDGIELVRPIRDHAPDTKVVVLDSEATPELKRRAFASGAWQVVEKPFELREVTGLVRTVLGLYPVRREHERFLCRVPLRVSLLPSRPDEPPDELPNLRCTTVDIGPGGMRLRTGYRLHVGQRLRAGLMRGEDPCACFVRAGCVAEVVWLTTGEGPCVAGLRWLL